MAYPGTRNAGRLPDVPNHVTDPTIVPGVGEKVIRELVGRLNTGTDGVSVARMTSPPGWEEPAQRPQFDEVTVVLSGEVLVEHDGGSITVRPGEAVLARAGERVRYSTPRGAEYLAICVPAFSPESVHREA
jgi:mannose-6-phosphate isomerase-like protein (cupin superfamily)